MLSASKCARPFCSAIPQSGRSGCTWKSSISICKKSSKRVCEKSLGIGFAFGDGCAFAVEGEHQRSRSGDVEPRTTKLVASGLAAFGQSSLRSCEISIRPASSPFSAWSWWTVVMGGLALAAAGMSSNPTTETSSGTESPRSVAHAIRTSLLWRIGVAHSSCRISPRERRRAMS